MIRLSKRAAHLALLATIWAWCVSLPHGSIADDALFQGIVVGKRAAHLSGDTAEDALYLGQVINDQRPGRGELNGTTKRALGLALPVAGVLPRDLQRSRSDNQPAAPRIGISIGVSAGGSSRAPARKPAPLGPRR